MKKILSLTTLLLSALAAGADTIDLSGTWDIRFDSKSGPVKTVMTLPGSMLTNGLGNEVGANTQWTGSLYDMSYYYSPRFEKYRRPGNIKFPFFLTPDREYVGTAVYSKNVYVPESWKGSEITLHLERPHIETEVYVNSKPAGRDSSLSVPHEFDLTPYIVPGSNNLVEIRIYNGIENVCVGQDSHSVTDQTQGNWNGITGKLQLRSRPKTHISSLRIFPRIDDKSVLLKIRLKNPGKRNDVTIIIDDTSRHKK